MDSNCNVSLPREKCVKCRKESTLLLSSRTLTGGVIGNCDHKFCRSCFRKENTATATARSIYHLFKCPRCHSPFYENILSLNEAILIGEAATLSNYVYPQLESTSDTVIMPEATYEVHQVNKLVVEKLQAVFILNPTNFNTLYFLFLSCTHGQRYLLRNHQPTGSVLFYTKKIVENAYKLFDHPAIAEPGNVFIRSQCCHQLTGVFLSYCNYPAALEYAKLAYDQLIILCFVFTKKDTLSRALPSSSCLHCGSLSETRWSFCTILRPGVSGSWAGSLSSTIERGISR